MQSFLSIIQPLFKFPHLFQKYPVQVIFPCRTQLRTRHVILSLVSFIPKRSPTIFLSFRTLTFSRSLGELFCRYFYNLDLSDFCLHDQTQIKHLTRLLHRLVVPEHSGSCPFTCLKIIQSLKSFCLCGLYLTFITLEVKTKFLKLKKVLDVNFPNQKKN